MTEVIRAFLIFGFCVAAQGHDIITTNITFDREILRIIYARCASCHREGGSAFSLMTYNEARPWAVAIKEETEERRMPPWGAVKGFGDFHDDQGLTPEQIELITSWVDGGVPEGEDKDLPPKPPEFPPAEKMDHPAREIVVSGELRLNDKLMLDGLWPAAVADNAEIQITAEFPDGSIEPLLWLHDYKNQFGHPFLLRNPIELPAGTVIHGVPQSAKVALLPAGSLPEHQHAQN